ncbi:MAG: phenylacetate-CoA oxygenase subunit PaaC [Bacteroidia bacterium]|nr:phenylacetate-CoA oxygenase subunit PaaC [Bacteroidia bacterium]
MNFEAIKDLLYRLGDDDLILGHRNSEWTGLGPILEEDIAFSSMAQDEIGHAQAYYMILNELFDEPAPDIIGFHRKAEDFRSCKLVEYPIGDYAFSLIRHFLYDVAESVRLQDLTRSNFKPLAELCKKLLREEKYHLLHAMTWVKQLGNSTDEAKQRLQQALDFAFPLAFGIFEPTAGSAALAEDGIMSAEADLEAHWLTEITGLIHDSGLQVPEVKDKTVGYGGRTGQHSEHLQPLLAEMTEVLSIDPTAIW